MSITQGPTHRQSQPPAPDPGLTAGALQAAVPATVAGPTGPAPDPRTTQPPSESPTLQASLPCQRCGCLDVPVVGPGRVPHAYRASCAHCGGFLRWVSQYTHEERVHRREQFRRKAMAQLLPTTKQLSYLLTLGYAGPMPATRHAASSLIATLEARKGGGR